MRILEKKIKENIIKIIIGTSETGMKGIKAPTKTISVLDTSVNEIHKKIKEMIENANWCYSKEIPR